MLQEWKCPVCLEQKHGGPCNRENQIVAAPKSAAPTFDPKGAAYASGDLFWDEKYVEVRDILKRLRYIAESPSKEHGGFHEQAIQTAKDAIEFIEQVMTQKKEMNPLLTRTKREVKRLIKLAEREAKRCVDNPTLSTSLAVDSAGDAFEAIKTYLKEKGAADVVSAEFEAHVRAAHASERWTRPSDETCAIYEGNRYIGEGKWLEDTKNIIDTHNASLQPAHASEHKAGAWPYCDCEICKPRAAHASEEQQEGNPQEYGDSN